MSKRRVFDIDFPVAPASPAPSPKPTSETPAKSSDLRRGPMATAISENADALRARAQAEQSIRDENDRLAHEFVRLKKLGLVVDRISLDLIATSKLTRDRSDNRDPELTELKESIQSIGLSNPIRVEEDGEGYQLVQGFRRLSAYRELYEETGLDAYATIPAGLVAKGETLQGLYRRMVDENLVRRDISFAEMAQLALSYAADAETDVQDVEGAIAILYASTGRQKRNYIRHFADLIDLIGDELRFPEALPRALGLDLRRWLGEDAHRCERVKQHLRDSSPNTAGEEVQALRAVLNSETDEDRPAAPPRSAKAKTTLRCVVPAGTVRCQAKNGKIEMAMERDFSLIDQRRLETAIAAFFSELDQDSEA